MSSAAALLAANPFPGLRSFEPAEADRFFGRQDQIDALVQRLDRSSLLAVSGASGCGKSSLVKAGLLNRLAQQYQQGGPGANTHWLPAVMQPGNRPLAHLAMALARALPQPPSTEPTAIDLAVPSAAAPAPDQPADEALTLRAASLLGQLRLGGLGLVEVVRLARLAVGERVLVVVDQFEEIFRFKRLADPDEASAFVKLLLQAAADSGAPISVVLTLRSDTLGGCADFAGLAEAVSAGSYLVPRLTRSQRKEAIVNPVELRGQRIAPRLVQRLLNEVSDSFDDLPVMQHALSRTWARWVDDQAEAGSAGSVIDRAPIDLGPIDVVPIDLVPIDLVHYQAVGGAADALSRHADEALQSLAGLAGPGMVERVFRALTERLAEGTELRRPLPFRQLCAVCGGGDSGTDEQKQVAADVAQVVERYRRADTAFLLPASTVALSANPTIDISHESLIRQWVPLRQWVVAESDAAAELKRLVDDAHAHAEADGELWRGRNLERARDWQRRNRPNAAWVQLCTGGDIEQAQATWQRVQGFLDKSSAAQRQEQRRQAGMRWGLGALVLMVLLVSVGAAFNSWSLQRQAQAGELAAHAILALAQDPARSAHLALLALDRDEGNDRAEYALRQAMATLEVARTEQIVALDQPITEARYSADKARLLVAGGNTVWLLDANTLATLATLKAPGVIDKAWELPGNGVLASSDAGVHLLARDGSNQGQVRATLSCQHAGARALSTAYQAGSASNPAAQLAVGCSDGELTRWELSATGAAKAHPLAGGGADAAAWTALGFSADGRWLAAGNADGTGLVWQRGVDAKPWIGALRPGRSPIQHGAAVRDIGFSRTEPSLLATASDDRSARVWTLDLVGRQLVMARDAEIRLKHERSVTVARFVDARASADDMGPLMTVSDKRVVFWSDENTQDERLHDDWVSEASVSDDGEYVVSASQDGTARVWSSRTTVPVAVLRGHHNGVTHALFGPAGHIVTTSRDQTVRLWRLNAPRLLVAGKPWQTTAAIDANGARAALCGEKDATRINCRLLPLQAAAAAAPAASAGATRQAEGEGFSEIRNAETVQDASLSADGTLLLAHRGTYDIHKTNQPVLWSLASRSEIKPAWLAGHVHAVFSSARPELLTVAADGALAVWPQAALGASDGAKPLQQWPAMPGRGSAAISPDGRWIAVQQGASALLFDRQAPSQPPRLLGGHAGDLRALAFSPDGNALVTASADRTARVWRLGGLRAGAPPAAVPAVVPSVELKGGHSAALTSARFSPDGAWVVTASADNSVRVWDAARGVERAALYRHANAVNSALFDASGEQILSSSHDGTAVLGRCDACRMPLPALRQQAKNTVKLAPEDSAALGADSAVRLSPFLLPAWFGASR